MTDDLSCAYCGVLVSVEATDDSRLHRDHIVPRSRGGGDTADNCVVACRKCNLEKKDRTPSEWRATGLPDWIYEIEKTLIERFKMKARGKRVTTTHVEIPGWHLVKAAGPVCLELPEIRDQCGRPADYEVSIMGDAWNARCSRCVRHYAERCQRELTFESYVLHTLAQLQAGTIRSSETALELIAKLGGVTLNEYLELAIQVARGPAENRAALLAVAPQLRLEIWQPLTVPDKE